MERPVLKDCHSEQVRALIEEHNTLVDAFRELQAGRIPTIQPRKIIKKEDGS
jgi:hypothetical protein